MSTYFATIRWSRAAAKFTDNRYSRAHTLTFDGGTVVCASNSPQVVRAPLSDPAGVDPEEMFVASLSSCHMLWFLSIAANHGYLVESYVDEAEGIMAKNADGRLAMTRVTLRPDVTYGGERRPDKCESDALHHEAHQECFIANSVKTEVIVQPV